MRVLVILFLYSIVYLSASRHSSLTEPLRRGKIIGGNDARPGSHPYLVSLHMKFLWTSLRFCSGSLLSEKWILTAGHCLKGNWLTNWLPMEALVGTNDLLQKASTALTVSIADQRVHPQYRGRLGAYDIAMLKTSMSIQFNDAVYPIALPFLIGSYKPNGKNLILAGWGDLATTAFMPGFQNKLQEASVMSMPFEECARMMKELKKKIDGYDSSPLNMAANMCSAPGPMNAAAACNGDSGAPLIQYVALDERDSTSTPSEETDCWVNKNIDFDETHTETNPIEDELTTATNPLEDELGTVADLVQQYIDEGLTPVAIGVVSWGPCGLVGAPTVYNNVSTYADFIQQHLYT